MHQQYLQDLLRSWGVDIYVSSQNNGERKWRNSHYILMLKVQNLTSRISVPHFQKQPLVDVPQTFRNFY